MQVHGVALNEGAWDVGILCVEDARVYDLLTGFAASPADILAGNMVRVLYSPESAPLGKAAMVYLNAGMPEAADLRISVGQYCWNNDESCVFVTPDGKYRVRLDADTVVQDAEGRVLSFEDIRPGVEMFVWAHFVTASVPGQVKPEKVVLL